MQGNHRRELGLQFGGSQGLDSGSFKGFLHVPRAMVINVNCIHIYIYVYMYIYIDSYIVSIDRGRRVASFEVYRAGMSWQIRLLGGCC